MEKNLINAIYDTLKQAGLASNEGEFSEFWLGQSECYLRTLRFKKTNASLGAIAICASRLQRAGASMMVSTYYQSRGRELLALAERCHDEINKEGIELDLTQHGDIIYEYQ